MSAPILHDAPKSGRRPWLRPLLLLFLVAALVLFAFRNDIFLLLHPPRPYVPPPQSHLWSLRSTIELYKAQHGNIPPDPANLQAQLCNATNAAGNTGGPTTTPAYSLGPYLEKFPENSLNHQSAVGPAPARNIGWVYTVHGTDFSLNLVNSAGTGILPD